MKKVDRIVFTSFLGPLLITFLITDFVFLMQFLWKYIDDLVGKGLEFSLILKLVSLFAVTIVPLALPLAILLSSIMTLGNMGENNELIGFKSSGVSLFRIMSSLIVFTGLLSIFLFYFSNNVLPSTHLKFYSLLYDIRKHKPALDIKEGTFYQGLEGYTIRIDSKDPDNKTIYGIKVYDHTNSRGNDNIVMADRGQMVISADGKFLIMTLYDGKQYQEIRKRSDAKEELHERTEMSFSKWRKVFDLSTFDMSRTDQALFKDHYHMLNLKQLRFEMDTIREQMEGKKFRLSRYNSSYVAINKESVDTSQFTITDSLLRDSFNVQMVLDGFDDPVIRANTLNTVNIMRNFASLIKRDVEASESLIAKHEMEVHRKFTLSAICLVLLFIGAPMGAIIRKGGFGVPVIIAILFFLLFHVLNIVGEKLSKEMVVDPAFGMWIPVSVLMPVSAFLTYKAAADSVIMRSDWYKRWILFRPFRKMADFLGK